MTSLHRLFAPLIVALMLVGCAAGGQPGGPGSNPQIAPRPAQPPSPGEAKEGVAEPLVVERMIVRNGRIQMIVGDVPAATDAAGALALRLGGFVASSSLRDDDGQQVANISLRVPSPRYGDAVRELRAMAVKVEEESGTAQDITEEFADLGAQLRNLEATEAQYLELVKKAQSVEDLLKVQQRLAEVRGQIERLKGRMNVLQRRSDLSQIDVTLKPDVVGFQPFRYARASWQASLRAIEVVVGIVIGGWWIWLLVGVGVVLLRRRGARVG